MRIVLAFVLFSLPSGAALACTGGAWAVSGLPDLRALSALAAGIALSVVAGLELFAAAIAAQWSTPVGKGRQPAWRVVGWLAACALLPPVAMFALYAVAPGAGGTLAEEWHVLLVVAGPALLAAWAAWAESRIGLRWARTLLVVHVAGFGIFRLGEAWGANGDRVLFTTTAIALPLLAVGLWRDTRYCVTPAGASDR